MAIQTEPEQTEIEQQERQQPEPQQIDAAQVWRAIGRLEGDTASIKEELKHIREDIRDFRALVIRLLFALLAVGGAILVALIAAIIALLQI